MKIMKLNEAIEKLEYLEEAVSKPFINAFERDVQIFPVEIKIKSSVRPDFGLVSVLAISDSGNVLKNVNNLIALRLGTLARTNGLGGGKVEKGAGLHGDAFIRWKKPGTEENSSKLVELTSKKLKSRLSRISPLAGEEVLTFKSYNSLEDLSNDMDRLK